ncbi:MAG: hypothetical protein JWR19_1340 [Pedosphaera sp.]|nr:hypothetical protein [Pedosphaera sp.]
MSKYYSSTQQRLTKLTDNFSFMRLLMFLSLMMLVGCALPKPATTTPPVVPVASATSAEPLVWDASTKEYTAKNGDIAAHLFFAVTNVSQADVLITEVTTSCGCTVARLPSDPWRLTPKAGGRIQVVVDLRGKSGELFKGIVVQSPTAPKQLNVRVIMPPGFTNGLNPTMADRLFNQEMSQADRQSVFKGSCVKCHLEPAFGKNGAALYQVACGICHDATHRATMVPDLKTLHRKMDQDYWKNWVTHGKEGTLMPAFTAKEGGPLDDQQIASLVTYLETQYPQPKIAPAKKD